MQWSAFEHRVAINLLSRGRAYVELHSLYRAGEDRQQQQQQQGVDSLIGAIMDVSDADDGEVVEEDGMFDMVYSGHCNKQGCKEVRSYSRLPGKLSAIRDFLKVRDPVSCMQLPSLPSLLHLPLSLSCTSTRERSLRGPSRPL